MHSADDIIAAGWRKCWIPAPTQQLVHIALAAPGGAAAERAAGAPAGSSHVLEHLLYRQNSAEGHPLDQLGGKFGCVTERERMIAYLAFSPNDGAQAVRRVCRWWDEMAFDELILQEERNVVRAEIRGAGRNALRLIRMRAISDLAPESHLQGDFVGDDSTLASLPLETLRKMHRRVRALGAAIVALGPTNPWEDHSLNTVQAVPWRPQLECIPQRRRIFLRGGSRTDSLVFVACLTPGLLSLNVLASYAAYALLAYGRVHPAQVSFHGKLRLRTLDVGLQMFAGAGLLSALALCDASRTQEVSRLLEDLLTEPMLGSAPDRVARCVRYHLAAMVDNPHDHTVAAAINLLHGAPPPTSLLSDAMEASPDELVRALGSFVHSGPVTYVLDADQ